MATENQNPLEMSDEDFLKLNDPTAEGEDQEAPASGSETISEENTDQNKENPEAADAGTAGATAPVVPATAAADAAQPAAQQPGTPTEPAAQAPAAKSEAQADKPAGQADPSPSGSQPQADGTQKPAEAEAQPIDYEGFYKRLIGKPIKANGKELVLNTPEEVERLVQMGAGYGRKIQDLQPYLKVIRMLEKNNLLDEGQLSFLIDVNQKNPDAIKKLIKDAGIDPLDINVADNVDYRPQNHAVSDDEMAFKQALDDLTVLPTGPQTLEIINRTWDDASKQELGRTPALLAVIQEQRDNGLYDQITAEIDRQKLLGRIPVSTPFIHAYKLAGDHLMATNGFKLPATTAQTPTIQPQPAPLVQPQPQPQVIATRPVTPKPQAANGAQAQAASPTKSVPAKAPTVQNPLAMADEDFLKTFAGRI